MEEYSRQRIRIKTRDGWHYGKFLSFKDNNIMIFIDASGNMSSLDIEGLSIEKEEVGPRGGKQWKSLGL